MVILPSIRQPNEGDWRCKMEHITLLCHNSSSSVYPSSLTDRMIHEYVLASVKIISQNQSSINPQLLCFWATVRCFASSLTDFHPWTFWTIVVKHLSTMQRQLPKGFSNTEHYGRSTEAWRSHGLCGGLVAWRWRAASLLWRRGGWFPWLGAKRCNLGAGKTHYENLIGRFKTFYQLFIFIVIILLSDPYFEIWVAITRDFREMHAPTQPFVDDWSICCGLHKQNREVPWCHGFNMFQHVSALCRSTARVLQYLFFVCMTAMSWSLFWNTSRVFCHVWSTTDP